MQQRVGAFQMVSESTFRSDIPVDRVGQFTGFTVFQHRQAQGWFNGAVTVMPTTSERIKSVLGEERPPVVGDQTHRFDNVFEDRSEIK